jgi:hypothetical protein
LPGRSISSGSASVAELSARHCEHCTLNSHQAGAGDNVSRKIYASYQQFRTAIVDWTTFPDALISTAAGWPDAVRPSDQRHEADADQQRKDKDKLMPARRSPIGLEIVREPDAIEGVQHSVGIASLRSAKHGSLLRFAATVMKCHFRPRIEVP